MYGTGIFYEEALDVVFPDAYMTAIKENERQEAILEHRKEIGYVNAVDQDTEELSEEEQRQLEEEPATENDENLQT